MTISMSEKMGLVDTNILVLASPNSLSNTNRSYALQFVVVQLLHVMTGDESPYYKPMV